MRLKAYAAKVLQTVILMLDYIWPKDKRILIFGSSMGLYASGNAKALFDYITGIPDSPFRCYFFLRKAGSDPRHCSFVPFNIKTLLLFLRAKTVIITHGLYDIGRFHNCSNRKKVIQLWHGHFGPKSDGYSSKELRGVHLLDLEKTAKKTTWFLVCSRMDAYRRAYSNVLHPRQILPLGYPRNDILLSDSQYRTKLRDLLSNLPVFEKVLLYAPTWRSYAKTEFFPFPDFNAESLEDTLRKQKAILLLRPHINESILMKESERIRNLDFQKCNEINDILKDVDVVITDYSSITADFLLLDRPIIYIPYDIQEFESRVGFCYKNFEFWNPGETVSTFVEFINAIEDALQGRDRYSEQRKMVNQFANEYQTANSCERIYKHLKRVLIGP
jgi:CDP-glycerol glycerophosphotransferase (TagB/SpsB family)